METIKLDVLTRDKKERIKQLLKEGFVPAILYGAKIKKNNNLKINAIDMEKILDQAGESTLIDLTINGKNEGKKVLIKDFQKHLTKDYLTHIDFYEVNMNEEIHAEIHLNFIGESKAVKESDGALIKNINEIEVKCLPGDLVKEIDVDISVLDTFDDVIKVSDINIPSGIKLVHKADTAVANVIPPREEEEEIIEKPEVEGEKIEGEEGEGEAKEEGKEGEKTEGEKEKGKEGEKTEGEAKDREKKK